MCNSAGLYVHVPFCRSKCRYCGFFSVVGDDDLISRTADAMATEIRALDDGQKFKTVYIGGGSPSVLPLKSFELLLASVKDRAPDATEITVEVNPEQARSEMFDLMTCYGVNRVSIGGQSFCDDQLKFLGRGHDSKQIIEAVQCASRGGFENISVDLIFAIPGQSLESWKKSLTAAVELPVKHVSAYSLTYEEDTPLGKELGAGAFKTAGEDVDRDMYEYAIDFLAENGFGQYEVSNFAKRGFECRHNLNYWANGNYVGVGPGASFHLGGVRGTNVEDVSDYVRLVRAGQEVVNRRERLDDIEKACETAVLNLRRLSGLDFEQFKQFTGYDASQIFAEPISLYKKLGLIECRNGRICLTRAALPIADSVLCDFAAV